jgi:hypothetical protein
VAEYGLLICGGGGDIYVTADTVNQMLNNGNGAAGLYPEGGSGPGGDEEGNSSDPSFDEYTQQQALQERIDEKAEAGAEEDMNQMSLQYVEYVYMQSHAPDTLQMLNNLKDCGTNYSSTVDGINFIFPKKEFSPPGSTLTPSQPTPIDQAIENLNPQALDLLIDMATQNNISDIEISSMWRNDPKKYGTDDPHNDGYSVDVLAVWSTGTRYSFNNLASDNTFQNGIYNWLQPNSSELLDPWQMYYGSGNPVPNYNRTQVEKDHQSHFHITGWILLW